MRNIANLSVHEIDATVAIRGFLENVDRMQISGWAFDDERPEHYLEVELLRDDEVIGRTIANLHRRDLESAAIGYGDHSFIFNCDSPINEIDIERISARAILADSTSVTLRSNAQLHGGANPSHEIKHIKFTGKTSNEAQYPVFILGSARSGTSAVMQALLNVTDFKGQEEGHFLDVLAPLLVHLKKFYSEKADEYSLGRNTMIAHVPQQFIRDGIYHALITATEQLFPAGKWIEKTPNANMIHLAPRFREIWPNARFIFMKRRGIDNIASRLRKFPYDFAHNCREWSAAMDAWIQVRREMCGVALELDQYFVANHPDEAAKRIGKLIKLDETETGRLGMALKSVRPQRTNDEFYRTRSLAEIGWSDERLSLFNEICGRNMTAYAYGTSESYFDGDSGILGCVDV